MGKDIKLSVLAIFLLGICIINISPVHFHDLNDYTGLISAKYFKSHPSEILRINADTALKENPYLYLLSYYRPLERLVWTVMYSMSGDNPAPYTVLSIVLFLGIVFNLYLLGGYLGRGRWSGIFSSVLFLTLIPSSYHLITYRTNISFCLEIYFLTLALFFIFKAIKENLKRFLVKGILIALMAYCSKESSMYIIPAVIVIFLLIYRREVRIGRKGITAVLIFCLFSACLFLNSKFLSWYKIRFMENASMFINEKIVFPKLSYYLNNIYANLGFMLILTIFLSIVLNKDRRREYTLIAAWFFISFLPLLLFPVISDAYLLDSLVPLALIGGIAGGGVIAPIYFNKTGFSNFKRTAALIIILLYVPLLVCNGARIRWIIRWAEDQRSRQYLIINNIRSSPSGGIIPVINEDEKQFYKAMLQFYGREDIKIEIPK